MVVVYIQPLGITSMLRSSCDRVSLFVLNSVVFLLRGSLVGSFWARSSLLFFAFIHFSSR